MPDDDVVSRLKAALSDRYTVERELGSGGMATVYLAEDLKLHRKVALKVLRPELASALGPDRFLQEIDIAAKRRSSTILTYSGCLTVVRQTASSTTSCRMYQVAHCVTDSIKKDSFPSTTL
jgi:serine/threonine protein kinase